MDSVVDFSTKRSLSICERHEDHVIVDNFFHDGQFWRARIPLAVEQVLGQAFNFSSVRTVQDKNGRRPEVDEWGHPQRRFSFINHLQARFWLAEDVELFRTDSKATQPCHRMRDFVYSVEATGPPGIKFSLLNGLLGRLTCTHRFLSTSEMIFEKFVLQNYVVEESPPLPLTDAELRAVLVGSIERSVHSAPDERYYLCLPFATNNCTSNPFRIVDQVARYSFRQRLGSMLFRLPLHPRFYLWVRGLDVDPGHRKFVHTDYEPFVASEKTQARKREKRG